MKGESKQDGEIVDPYILVTAPSPPTETDSTDSNAETDSNDCFPEVLHSGPVRIELTSTFLTLELSLIVLFLPGRPPNGK